MNYTTLILNDLSVNIRLSSFEKENAGEYHAIIEGNNTLLNVEKQYANIEAALKHLVEKVLPHTATPVLERWFSSDAINHKTFLQHEKNEHTAVSIVQQPPLNGGKAILWVYFVENARVTPNGENAIVMEHAAYRHLFDMQLHDRSKDEYAQTREIFNNYTGKLNRQGLTLADNVIRTWIFVQGVDTHYADMVNARKQHFLEQGLTEQTHYIASTGIEGKYIHPETLVLMDAYAIAGIDQQQITYLKGTTHLCLTHSYGVTFERATAVDYGDRRHIFVSGTASIDNKGEIVFPLDVVKQTERTFENIGVLLGEGGATMKDVSQMIVYLRDTADYHIVSSYIEEKYPDIPVAIVYAPVCRPGWLIEIECIAIKETENRCYAAF